MKTNPGGQLAVEEIIGRDVLCEAIREALKTQSVIMVAERRIGKTSIMKILEANSNDNWVAIYTDLEKVQNIQNFAETIYSVVQQYLSGKQQAVNLAKRLGSKLGGVEANGYKLPDFFEKTWQEVLQESIAILSEEQASTGNQLLFLWDEFPYMLFNILENDGEQTVKEVLDLLRAFRKQFENFRMVVTGSIGLHHVVKELNKKSYKNEPINDVKRIEVQPLEDQDAQMLAKALLKGENIETDDIELLAQVIAEQTDNFPFYIHHIVSDLKTRRKKATVKCVEEIIINHLTEDEDTWELRHYEKRIKDYYDLDEKVVKLALDEIALHQKQGLTPKELLERLKTQIDFDDIEKLRELLIQMNKDHYLAKDTQNSKYSFRFPLVLRWWMIFRELN